MNDKCKYCDYVSECSRKCEYDSILCKVQRSFPKVVDKSYEQLQQENKQLKDNWNMLKEHLINRYNNGPESISYRQAFIEIRESMQVLEIQQKFELERGNSNE